MKDTLLETRNLKKNFNGLVAVNHVDFLVNKGELRSVIGPNGAGKTTFFNLISGHLKPSGGTIVFEGEDITNLPVHRRSHLGISRSFQRTNIFPRLTTFENIRIAAQSRKVTYAFWGHADKDKESITKAERMLDLVRLVEQRDIAAGNLSYGQQRYLEIGISLVTDPKLLLLDEPTAGLSPDESIQATKFVKELSKDVTIILVEHDMEVVMEISDSITVLHNGAILCEGSPETVRCDKKVQEVYLRETIC